MSLINLEAKWANKKKKKSEKCRQRRIILVQVAVANNKSLLFLVPFVYCFPLFSVAFDSDALLFLVTDANILLFSIVGSGVLSLIASSSPMFAVFERLLHAISG